MANYILLATLLMMLFIMTLPSGAIDNGNTDNISNITPENISNITTTVYRSLVDQDYGFYRVNDITSSKQVSYDNNYTLTIYVGDSVIWVNDATPDEPLTIVSKDNLWGNRSAYLRWNYQKFNYTFNQSGIYDIYIREYPRLKHQTVVVKDIEGVETKIVPTSTISLTMNQTSNKTDNKIEYNKTEDNANVSVNKDTTNKNIIPIDAIIAIAGIILLAIYIFRKK